MNTFQTLLDAMGPSPDHVAATLLAFAVYQGTITLEEAKQLAAAVPHDSQTVCEALAPKLEKVGLMTPAQVNGILEIGVSAKEEKVPAKEEKVPGEKELSTEDYNQLMGDVLNGETEPSIKTAEALEVWPKLVKEIKAATEKGYVISMVNEWPNL